MINIPEKYKNAIKSMMKKDKLIILLIIGVIFLLINFPAKTKKNTTDTKENTTGEIEENSYVKNMEKRLKQVLSQIEGVGENEVAITVKNNGKSIVQKTNKDDYSQDEKADETPEICGVLIVAEGADDIEINSKITKATSVLFGISINRINVLKMEV